MGTRGYMFTMVLVHEAFELFATKVETFKLSCRWVSSTKAHGSSEGARLHGGLKPCLTTDGAIVVLVDR